MALAVDSAIESGVILPSNLPLPADTFGRAAQTGRPRKARASMLVRATSSHHPATRSVIHIVGMTRGAVSTVVAPAAGQSAGATASACARSGRSASAGEGRYSGAAVTGLAEARRQRPPERELRPPLRFLGWGAFESGRDHRVGNVLALRRAGPHRRCRLVHNFSAGRRTRPPGVVAPPSLSSPWPESSLSSLR